MTTTSCLRDLSHLVDEIRLRASTNRLLVAVAGPPGSGKSTIADALRLELISCTSLTAEVLPMDGFHFDDTLLEQFGRKNRKGAPDTFDVEGLYATLQRVKQAYKKTDIAVPVFDRSLELSRASARLISRDTRIVIVEGNYLLLSTAPWSDLHGLHDMSVMITCDPKTLRDRLLARWHAHGFSETQSKEKVEQNDLVNANTVMVESIEADFCLKNE